MKYNVYLIVITFSLILSCGKKKETKTTVEKEVKTTVEKEIDIDGLAYQLVFDGIKSESDYDQVIASYAANRLNNPKKAMSMDGLSEYAKIDNHDNLNPTEGLTLSIWYKPISFKGSGNDPLVVKPFSGEGAPFTQYHLNVTGNEYSKSEGIFKFGLSVDGKYNSIKTPVNTWSPNNWYNVTATYDGTAMKLYVNGELKNSRAVTGKIDVYNTDLFVGKNQIKPNKFIHTPGTYDNLRIYNRALTKEEVRMLSE